MKKITNLELSSLVLFLEITMFLGIVSNIIKTFTGINEWLPLVISLLLSTITLLLFLYIMNHEDNLNIKEKLNKLPCGIILNILLDLIYLIIGITVLYNISNFITSQLLYRTPTIICTILFTILVVYHSSCGINSITRISIIMIFFNLILYLISATSLYPYINLSNLLPILKEDTSNIFLTSLKVLATNSYPMLILGIIPKDKITNKKKYNKTITITYLIGAILLISISLITLSVLGIHLLKLYEYPEYIVLEKIKLFGFLERIENIVSNQWITSSYIYLTLIVYFISNTTNNKFKNKKLINIFIGLILILTSTYIFKSNTMFEYYIKYIFPYICMSLIIFYIILSIYTFISNKKKKSAIM